MIPFNRPAVLGDEVDYLRAVIESRRLSGDGFFSKKCQDWIEQHMGCQKALLTPSCTHALEMAAVLLDIHAGDEVIMPSYTFTSTANAFLLRGAHIVFVDIRPDTMNINEKLIEKAVTEKTKAIVVVHYAGVACDMDAIMDIAKSHDLFVVEDAAQAVMSSYRGKPLGSIGHLGCYSFHETKNFTSGEGGALLINDDEFISRAEIIREKGTNRKQFILGQVDKYSWVDIGSSFLPSELNAAYLYAQLNRSAVITEKRLSVWRLYHDGLSDLAEKGKISLPKVPEDCIHNAHMFYIKAENMIERNRLISFLKEKGITAAFHYIPLHQSAAGKRWGRFFGKDEYTTKESERLLRLPLYFDLSVEEAGTVIEQIHAFYKSIVQ
ncbi:MAG: dTDP-4-amino-4,6-dideoxygalactose transaminase [Tuberibacillus sp.]